MPTHCEFIAASFNRRKAAVFDVDAHANTIEHALARSDCSVAHSTSRSPREAVSQ